MKFGMGNRFGLCITITDLHVVVIIIINEFMNS